MKVAAWILAVGLVPLASCAGGSASNPEDSSPEAVSQTLPTPESDLGQSSTVETLPKLIDPSTDIDAIDRPVVLWFWSPG